MTSVAIMHPTSPSSSPRLPSPPPMAEDQTRQSSSTVTSTSATSRRTRPGTKAADIVEAPLGELSEIDSPFALAEHLKALHFSFTRPSESPLEHAINREQATLLSQPPSGVDRQIWLYELSRFLIQKANAVIVGLFSDSPPCSAQTCSEMRASEWQYLCAVHNPPKACCAIDYCCHTLDWAANSLTNPKEFPSRLSLGTENTVPTNQVKTITNIMRRVYRIFAHAWFSHREVFWKIEGRTGLYTFFKTVCDEFGLIPEDNYTIPAEAQDGESSQPSAPVHEPTAILKREVKNEEGSPPSQAPGATTRRHRQSSRGASVDTVLEESEEDDPGAQPEVPRTLARADTQVHLSKSPASSPRFSGSAFAKQNLASSPPPSSDGHFDTQEAREEVPPVSHSRKQRSNFSPVSFSPVSPKAHTFEEFAKDRDESLEKAAEAAAAEQKDESAKLAVEAETSKDKEAGPSVPETEVAPTDAAEPEAATKSVGD